jgi:rod shape-determining protein MreB
MGSNDINAALINHIRRHRGLIIGEETAESLKRDFVSANPPEDLAKEMNLRGRDVQTRSPGAVDVTAGELYPVAEGIIRKVSALVTDSLTELRPEVAADIYDRGIILTGGGALFNGIDQYLRNQTSLPVSIADEPQYATVRGLLKMFESKDLLKKVARNEPRLVQSAEVPFEA